jgi:hypothetical protein
MSNINIPGLITGKKTELEKHLTDAELQRERLRYAEMQTYQSKQDKLKAITNVVNNNGIPMSSNLNYVEPGLGTGQPYWGIDFPQQQPYQQPLELDDYKKFFPPYQEPKKYGPSPSRTGTSTDLQDWQDQIAKALKPKKSAFEELLDSMFNQSEKQEFLTTLGYEFNSEFFIRKSLDETKEPFKWDNNPNNINLVFLKEITVKFKNLLLTKATLKIRL